MITTEPTKYSDNSLCAAGPAGAEIVVGTPGRVIDFVESGKLPLDKVGGAL